MPTTDDLQRTKVVARRRLLGAALLLLLIALLLPQFLNKKAPESIQAADIRVATPTAPSQPDVGNGSKLQREGASNDPPALDASAQSNSSDEPVAKSQEPAAKSQEPVAKTQEPAVKRQEPASHANTANATQPLPQPEKNTTSKIAPPATVVPAPAEQWVLQFGVFKDKANANKTVALAKKHGLKPHVESINDNGTHKYMVRAGPYKTRAAADKERDKLLSAKIKSLVLPANP